MIGSELPVDISIDDLTVAYDRHPAVHHLSGRFEAGSLTAVVGPNGAGKSTLLKAIVGAISPAQGRIEVGGIDRRTIAYLPQAADIDLSFPISVDDTVVLGLWRRLGAFRGVTPPDRDAVAEALETVGLNGFGRRLIATLSVGQMQRALFARMLLQDSSIVLLDEPFAALDARTTDDLLALVRRWHGQRRTVVAVLHDLDAVRASFPRTLLLAREPVAWGSTGDVLSAANLRRARAMAESWHDDAASCRVQAA
jgi:zinc/manganese transport system ATP-binding protein